MRKDLKTGMFVGIGLVFVGWVLFALYSDTLQQRRQKQLIGLPEAPILPSVQPAVVAEQQLEPESPVDLQTPPEEESSPVEKLKKELLPTQQIHVVTSGQTLSSISILYYGKADNWQAILNANADVLKRPSQLRPGMRLKIPPK